MTDADSERARRRIVQPEDSIPRHPYLGSAIVRALVMPDERSPRRVIAAHEPLFRGFPIRGRAAFRWLQQDATVHAHERGTQPGGLIWFENPANSGDSRTKSVERVRKGLPAGSRPQ